ncbi:MAG TPA: sulfatase [Gemmatimonadales bacterium]|jgi:arylsulfatase A-like enzyme|nr:sulfatase [Gemmatimonadales bacterium]
MTATRETVTNRLPGTLLLVLWFALVSGSIEALWRVFQVAVQHKVILMPVHVVWMAAVADIFWIGVPALLLLLLHLVWPRIVRSGLIVGVMAVMGFIPVLLLITGMHKLVALFLALGLGYQTTRLILGHQAGFGRLVRRSVIPLLLLVAIGGASIGVVRTIQERRARAALAAAEPGSPNVLLIIWDTVRGQSLSAYGYERPTTPFLESLAREGTRFDRAISTAPWTLPSHAGMFTGHRPTDLVVDIYHPIVDSFPTLAGALAARGYVTGGFVANMSFTTREHGLSRDFSHYDDYPVSPGTAIWSSRLGNVIMEQEFVRKALNFWDDLDRKTAAGVNRQFLRWVDHRGNRPFFAFLNYYDSHRPYMSVEPYKSRFVRDSSGRFHPRRSHLNFKAASKDEIRWMWDNYDATIAYQDEQVRQLLEELKRRGLLDNTLVIVTADHGEHFGDHNRLGHMNSLYRTLLQVPLIMRMPGRVPAGTVVTTPVSLADLPRTILDLSGAGDTAGIPGTSMRRFWNGAAPDTSAPPEPVFSEVGTRKGSGPYSLIAGGYHYIAWQGQTRKSQIYDVAADPWELNDQFGKAAMEPLMPGFQELSVIYMGRHALERDSTAKNDEEIVAPGQ